MVQFKPVEMYKHRKLLDYNSFLGKVPAIITNFLLCAGDKLKIWICWFELRSMKTHEMGALEQKPTETVLGPPS